MFLRSEHLKPRQFARFKALDDTFVSFGSQVNQGLGIIRDISNGGLSFEYIPKARPLKKINQIDIISDGKHFRFEKLPCRKIYELPLEDGDYTPVQMYQVGIQFGDIESKKINKLIHFIGDLN